MKPKTETQAEFTKTAEDLKGLETLLGEFPKLLTKTNTNVSAIPDLYPIYNLTNFVEVLKIIKQFEELDPKVKEHATEYAQIKRIQLGEVSPASFLTLFLVTGQTTKQHMVSATMKFMILANKVSNT
jgi:hypothetical protein